MLLKITNNCETEELNNSNRSESNMSDHNNVKNGVKLLKTSDQWATAESFFEAELPAHKIGKNNLELITQKLPDTIYFTLNKSLILL